jgi:nitrogen fixation-related uncharacterized protein
MMNPTLACFFCGVDSQATAWFLGLFVVSMVLASVSFFLWATSKGDFRHLETTALDPLRDPEPLPQADASPRTGRHPAGPTSA